MFRAFKKFWMVSALLLLAGGPSAFGFSLLGPTNAEAFQIPAIGYNLSGAATGFGDNGGNADIGTPRNIAEEYRWNTPNLFYAFDANFLGFFGTGGAAQVDAAFAMFNNLSNVSSYSSDLSEWPLNTSRINFTAANLNLLDLKSSTMGLIIEQLGLAQPDRWTWALHDRFPVPGAPCPNIDYVVIQRNYDPVTQLFSPMVNDVLYDYVIAELCPLNPNPFAPLLADAVEINPDTDRVADNLTAVASQSIIFGQYYTSLTRDDIGGLRYLLSFTNLNTEATETNTPSFLVVSNNSESLLVTSDLSTLIAQARTNNPAALQALFPTLQIVSFTSTFTNVVSTNIVAFFTNSPFAPAGTPATVAFATNFTTNVLQVFHYTFGNVVTNSFFSKQFVTSQTITVGPKPFAPPGTLSTNVTSTTFVTNIPSGDFFIIPSNQCGFSVVSTQLATLVLTTNTIVATNPPGVTNINGQTFTNNVITYFTNHTLIVSIPTCVPGTVALRQGIEKMHFFRQDFDSLLGQTWTPVTNTYHITMVTNNVPIVQTFYRVATRPDILFTAADLTPGPAAVPAANAVARTSPHFGPDQLPGPGIIQPLIQFTFNKVGPVFLNEGPFFLGGEITTIGVAGFTQTNSALEFMWGSFDGTTNPPVVYPNTVTLASLENNVFLQITVTGPLPNGNVGQPYSVQLQATGVQPPPYTWSLAPNSPGLPDGLNLTSDGTNATISGTPTATGVFDFVLQVSDSAGRVSQRNFDIEIDP